MMAGFWEVGCGEEDASWSVGLDSCLFRGCQVCHPDADASTVRHFTDMVKAFITPGVTLTVFPLITGCIIKSGELMAWGNLTSNLTS